MFSSSCDYTVTDVTTNQSRSTCPTSVSGSSVTIETNGLSIRAGDTVHVGASDVENAPSSGSQTLSVSTSSDSAASTSFSLVAASPVSGVSVSLSTNVAGASGVDYTAGFTTSTTGALDPNNGTITLSTSGATVFADDCGYTLTDVTTNQSTTTCPTDYSGSAVTISTGINIRAGDTVQVGAVEVENAPSSGLQTLSVSTSSDLTASTSFSLVAGSHVSGVSVALTSNAAGASGVDYTVGFTTSATGALDPTNGTIIISTSGPTAFSSNCNYTLTDVTTNQSTTTCPTVVSGSTVTIDTGGLTIHDGDTVQVGAVEVQNAPSSGSQTLSVSTSSDLAASTSFSLVAASPVSGVSVSLSTSAAGANGVDYTVGFATSTTGALDPNNGTITLSTSGATVFADELRLHADRRHVEPVDDDVPDQRVGIDGHDRHGRSHHPRQRHRARREPTRSRTRRPAARRPSPCRPRRTSPRARRSPSWRRAPCRAFR